VGLSGPKDYGAMPQPFSVSDLVLRPMLNHNDKNTITYHTKAGKIYASQAPLRGTTYLVILCPDCQVRPGHHRTLQRVAICLSALVVYSQIIRDSTSAPFYASMHEP